MQQRTWKEAAGGNRKAIFVIAPEHEKALRSEAFRRAAEAGSSKPDASAVLREVLDAWLKRKK